jgi:hypothetical protein
MRTKFWVYLKNEDTTTMLELRHVLDMEGQSLTPFRDRPMRNQVSLWHATLWGVQVVCKVGPPQGCMENDEYLPGPLEMEAKAAHLLTALPKLADAMAVYLFAGRVPAEALASMVRGTCARSVAAVALWKKCTHLDMVVTEDFGPTVSELCIVAAETILDDAELEAWTLRTLLRVFVALKQLREEGGTRMQDAKLDNLGYKDRKLCFIDLEFAHSENMPNPNADFDGCGMEPFYEDGSDEFDCHTVVYYLLYFCGARYTTLPKLEQLRASLFGPEWPMHHRKDRRVNKAGHCIVYKTSSAATFPCAPCTFPVAIEATLQALAASH